MTTTNPMAFVGKPGIIDFRDHVVPDLGEQDVKISVKAVTLCGSDLHIFKGKHPAAPLPVAVGHEIAGEVSEIGAAVDGLKVGDRVAVEPIINCNQCYFCRRGQYHLCTDISFQYRVGQGGLTPEFITPARWAHLLPADLPFDQGAAIEPLSVAVHAVKKADIQLGQTVAIFGGGSIGLLLLLVSKSAGCSKTFIVDIQEFRLNQAKQLGASFTLNNLEVDAVREIRRLTGSLGVDVAFEAVGLELTLVQALQSLKKGGQAAVIGLFEEDSVNLPANIFVQNEIGLVGSQGYCWDFNTSIELVENGRIDLAPLITHHFPLSETQEAFDLLANPASEAIKIAIMLEE